MDGDLRPPEFEDGGRQVGHGAVRPDHLAQGEAAVVWPREGGDVDGDPGQHVGEGGPHVFMASEVSSLSKMLSTTSSGKSLSLSFPGTKLGVCIALHYMQIKLS